MKKNSISTYAILFLFALSCPIPWIAVKYSGYHLHSYTQTFLSGFAIVGAAFLISWASELAQFDLSRSFAMALIALIAVFPEYAVDIYLAWSAGKDPLYVPLVSANMTGANRLLIGIGWSVTIFLSWWALRSKRKINRNTFHIILEKDLSTEIGFLSIATLYCFIIPIKGAISIIDTLLLSSIFLLYILTTFRQPHKEPEIEGMLLLLSVLKPVWRRILIVAIFIYSALVIFISTEAFAEGLIKTGSIMGIDEFLLIQWIAPLASEAPELIIISYFALKGLSTSSMTAVISSKINQWTLLVASLPVAFSISSGGAHSIPLLERSREEVLLTAAQSLFALSILVNLKISLLEAGALFLLFSTQLFFTSIYVRYLYSVLYILLSVIIIFKQREYILDLLNYLKKHLLPGRLN